MRVKGLEPPRLAAPDPKSGASANFATPATTTKHNGFFGCGKPKAKLSSPWHCFGMDQLEEILGKTRLLARTKALDMVELPKSYRNRYPHELSGGQRQRVGIARALALNPKLLVADEPTSALDVSVQARVLELLQEIQKKQQFATLFVSHDLAVVDLLSDHIAVMQHGVIVEQGSKDQILRNPQQEYTKRLIAAVPVPDPEEQAKRRQASRNSK